MTTTAACCTAQETETPQQAGAQSKNKSPLVVMTILVLITTALTYVVRSGAFVYDKKKIVPGSFHPIEKIYGFPAVLFGGEVPEGKAAPVSLAQMFHAIPEGITQQADLIVMVMFIGGMFGVLQAGGAIDAGLEKLLKAVKGNVFILVPMLMIFFSFGSTFMGMAKEYLLVIPIVVAMTNRLKLPAVIGLAIVAIPVKVGYAASLTNPFALTIAQPLVGVEIFSGMWLRVLTYVLMMAAGIGFVLFTIIRHRRGNDVVSFEFAGRDLDRRQAINLILLAVGVAFMVFGAQTWHWKSLELAAYYLLLAVIFGLVSGFGASRIGTEFVNGMKKVMIAAVLIGMAAAVAIILKEGQIMDTLIKFLVGIVSGHGAYVSAYIMTFCQMALDLVIPSTSGQAAVTMPILGPVGQLVGITPQTTVFAFLMGNGLTNVITPTSSGLLIFLAAAEVSWTRWCKYVWPLFLILGAIAFAMITVAVAVGY